MDKLPFYTFRGGRGVPSSRFLTLGLLAAAFSLVSFHLILGYQYATSTSHNIPINATSILDKCRLLNVKPGVSHNFHRRTQSDRFVPGTPPILIKNATIWTGRVSGLEVVVGDLLLSKGLIKAVGDIDQHVLDAYGSDLVVADAGGAWVSPGIVDLHSHLGVYSAPSLQGSRDFNSRKGLVQPWLRSLDGLNTHDESYRLSISGGVTTAIILPGSANAIGGQAFVIKLRPTNERSSSSMLLEPPFSFNGSSIDASSPPRWRQMKHACGENPTRFYDGSRMDTIWAFRKGYDTARKIKKSQDEYCAKALREEWNDLGLFPEDLQWEALVDVLRGRVKIHTHCYEATDLDGLIRMTNEFEFSIAAFHHAHETYLVPELLKKAYGGPPAAALFATNARYKREAYRGSEFAASILADNGIQVVMKSDHPVLNSRHLVYEAQQAHYYGLPDNLALAAVTSTPATVMGQDHRIGFIKPGYDADIVVWDSHPLALGAAPKQVYIDGIPQIDKPFTIEKPRDLQRVPVTPNFDKEAEEVLKYDGLPPLEPKKADSDTVVFTNMSSIYIRHGRDIIRVFSATKHEEAGTVVVQNGVVTCAGKCSLASTSLATPRIDLEGGSIVPGLITYGSPLGLDNIQYEPSTNDGEVPDPLTTRVPNILGGEGSVIRAVDGLQYGGRDMLLAYRAGITSGIVAPKSGGFLSGLSTVFATGVAHKLQRGAVVQDVVALHVAIGAGSPSVSTQVAALRRLLLGEGRGELAARFDDVVKGKLPLIVEVQNADIMASLIQLKKEVEENSKTSVRLIFSGASEAHLLAKEIGQAGIGVILKSPRPFPGTWGSRRILPGPPLSKKSALAHLMAYNVTVGLGTEEAWNARNLRFDIAWAALEAGGDLSTVDALALASVNLEGLLAVKTDNNDLIATKGGSLLGFEGRVVGIISPTRGVVDLL